MSWSRVQVQLLIDLYRNHPCLYAVKHKEYKNKHARNDALDLICSEIVKIRPGTGVVEIKNKFNNIRTNFLAQYRKYKNSFHSGMGEDEVYKPNIWYFNAMMFIVEHTTPRESIDSISSPSLQSPPDILDSLDEYPPSDSQLSILDLQEQSQEFIVDPQGDIQESRGTQESVFDNNVSETEPQSTQRKSDKIKILSVQCLTPTSSTRESMTTTYKPDNIEGSAVKPTKKKRKVDTEDTIIETATNSLREIQKAIVAGNIANTAPNSENVQANLTQSQIFGNFVAKQLSFIENRNEDLFLDIQHAISDIIYEARKECNNKGHNNQIVL